MVGIVVRTISVPSRKPPRPMMIGYRDRSAALASVPKRPRLRTHQAIHSSESTVAVDRPSARPEEDLRHRAGAARRCEVDRLRLVKGDVHLAGVEEGVDQPAAGLRLHGEEAACVPDPRQHDLLAVRPGGQEFLRHDLRRR